MTTVVKMLHFENAERLTRELNQKQWTTFGPKVVTLVYSRLMSNKEL